MPKTQVEGEVEKWYSTPKKSTTKIRLVTAFDEEQNRSKVLTKIAARGFVIDPDIVGLIGTLPLGMDAYFYRFRFEVAGNEIIVSGDWSVQEMDVTNPALYTYSWRPITKESEGIGSPKYEVLYSFSLAFQYIEIWYNR